MLCWLAEQHPHDERGGYGWKYVKTNSFDDFNDFIVLHN